MSCDELFCRAELIGWPTFCRNRRNADFEVLALRTGRGVSSSGTGRAACSAAHSDSDGAARGGDDRDARLAAAWQAAKALRQRQAQRCGSSRDSVGTYSQTLAAVLSCVAFSLKTPCLSNLGRQKSDLNVGIAALHLKY